jgi:hypothetical protein
MAQVLFCFVFAILFFVNAADTQNSALEIVDTIAAVFYTVIGAVAGWQAARND